MNNNKTNNTIISEAFNQSQIILLDNTQCQKQVHLTMERLRRTPITKQSTHKNTPQCHYHQIVTSTLIHFDFICHQTRVITKTLQLSVANTPLNEQVTNSVSKQSSSHLAELIMMKKRKQPVPLVQIVPLKLQNTSNKSSIIGGGGYAGAVRAEEKKSRYDVILNYCNDLFVCSGFHGWR